MTKRKAITERMKIDCLLSLAGDEPICCRGCGVPLMPGDKIEWDHSHPVELDGPHEYQNLRPMHAECHKKKTSGTKATTAGSDIHKIRKAQRIAKGGKKRKGPKIPSHPFVKSVDGSKGWAYKKIKDRKGT